ncbi:hypothetical protein K505DRAFT_331832 [Melanomma pulvis-pyrius CBS 109.77]|uniref:Uncharacterized protein n=1 Tax=Melanomma pulvis-pyrius CBS 109.77 TaxID=1314802 RepID=A0A6A6XUL0_9PLEO|nr:hypothetical protein K505DRAFT_331832 [Melanomma pulvis-pyrius CBS 109.77]
MFYITLLDRSKDGLGSFIGWMKQATASKIIILSSRLLAKSDGRSKNSNGFEDEQCDEANKVEQDVWTDIAPGEVKVIASAREITKMNRQQPFALPRSLDG